MLDRQEVFDLPPSSRIALVRSILFDILRNKEKVNGYTREQILKAWQALEGK